MGVCTSCENANAPHNSNGNQPYPSIVDVIK